MLRISIGEREWNVSTLDEPFPGKGQDAWALGARSACVIDGATPLLEEWPQDIAEYAAAAALALVEQSDVVSNDIVRIWSNTVTELNKSFTPEGYKRTAGAALVMSRGSWVTFSTLGDVMCLLQTVSGPVQILDRTLPGLDAEAAAHGWRTEELIANRRRANQADGYPVLGDNPDSVANAETRVVAADELMAFWLISDGVWRWLPEDCEEAVALLNSAAGDLRYSLKSNWDDDATLLAFSPFYPH